MSNIVKPYDPSGGKKEQVREMFDAIAPGYDFLNHFLSLGIDRHWRRVLVRMVARDFRGHREVRVLDVATGTGDLAIALSGGVAGARVVGVDLSGEMLEIGREKIRERGLMGLDGLPRIEMVQGDAEALPFADEQFDVVSSAFGVRNFEDTELGIREMVRVTSIGGEVLVLEFSRIQGVVLRRLFEFYFGVVLPRIGALVSRDSRAYSYLPESVKAFADSREFLSIMERSGLNDCSVRRLSFGIATIYKGKRIK